MEFSIGERLMLLSLLPREGDFLSLKAVRSTRETLSESLSEDAERTYTKQAEDGKKTEEKVLIRNEKGGFHWPDEHDRLVAIELSPRVSKIITEQLEALDKQKKLTENHISLYEKFFPDQE